LEHHNNNNNKKENWGIKQASPAIAQRQAKKKIQGNLHSILATGKRPRTFLFDPLETNKARHARQKTNDDHSHNDGCVHNFLDYDKKKSDDTTNTRPEVDSKRSARRRRKKKGRLIKRFLPHTVKQEKENSAVFLFFSHSASFLFFCPVLDVDTRFPLSSRFFLFCFPLFLHFFLSPNGPHAPTFSLPQDKKNRKHYDP